MVDIGLDLDDRSWAWSFFYLREFLPLAPESKLLPSCLNAKDVELPSWTSGLPPSSAPGPRTTVFSSLPLLEKTLLVLKCKLNRFNWETNRQNDCSRYISSASKPMMTNRYKSCTKSSQETYISPFVSASTSKVAFSLSTQRFSSSNSRCLFS